MIARKTFREIRWMALAYLLILELLCVPVLLLWPEIYDDLQKSTLMRNLSVDFLKRISEGVSDKSEQVAYLNWCAVMLFFRSTNLAGVAGAVLFGTGLFAREREAQTFEFLLSKPVGRGRLLWGKFWPCALCLTLPIFAVNLSAIFWSRQIELDLPLGPLLLASLHAACFVVMFLAFTTWVSLLCRVQAHVAAVVGAVAVTQIGIYLTQRIRPFSLFRLVDFDWYGPLLSGHKSAAEMFDPFGGGGFTGYVLAAALLFYGLACRALVRAEP